MIENNQMFNEVTLLIEPVWNRNESGSTPHFHRESAFNRTSMESKLRVATAISERISAFNRTSMESKLRLL